MIDKTDTAFLLFSAALVLLMTPALAVFYGGLVRRKNVLSVVIQSLIMISIVTLEWIYVGYSLSFGPDLHGIIGSLKYFALRGVGLEPSPDYASTVPHMVFMIYQCMFAVITPALITGAFAERVRFRGFVIFSLLWALVVYNPLCHWIWGGGWLGKLGVLDFAGGLVVHASCGAAALVTALVIGPRKGYGREPFIPHNLLLTVIGTGLLWFGWFGFNAGSALEVNGTAVQAFVNTHVAAMTAMAVWVLVERFHQGKPTTLGACSGAIAGLATITPAAGFVEVNAAVLIGVLAGLICYLAVLAKNRLGYDDALDVVGIHGVGGVIGTLCVGLLSEEGKFVPQLIGVAATVVYTLVATFILAKVVDVVFGFRADSEAEVNGLDIAEHGEEAYAF
ncbi:ammonium transporter [Thermosulfurimonas dismutans]|uniref:Ammonium transporter n=1 Tax=Thermosulfurimonas dismutans TaxID=999894 RepID=A0A179D2G0_9BACT|nr:ammonium transporter [Thermosulfurimonas dismutans]OAQ20250.1 Ammonium transporter [Thermosulfurimonas dismutans]